MAGRCSPVLAIACAGALLAAACGGPAPDRASAGRGEPPARPRPRGRARGTELRSPDVEGRMDPVPRARLVSCPHAGRLEVQFDPRGTVTLVAGGRSLAHGTIGTRAVNRACRRLGRMRRATAGTTRQRNQRTALTCASARRAVRGPSQERAGRPRDRLDRGRAEVRPAPHHAVGGGGARRIAHLLRARLPRALTFSPGMPASLPAAASVQPPQRRSRPAPARCSGAQPADPRRSA